MTCAVGMRADIGDMTATVTKNAEARSACLSYSWALIFVRVEARISPFYRASLCKTQYTLRKFSPACSTYKKKQIKTETQQRDVESWIRCKDMPGQNILQLYATPTPCRVLLIAEGCICRCTWWWVVWRLEPFPVLASAARQLGRSGTDQSTDTERSLKVTASWTSNSHGDM